MPVLLLILLPALAVSAFLLKVAVGFADRVVARTGRPRARGASGYAFLPDRPVPPPQPGIPMPSFLRAVGIQLVAGFTLLGIGLVVWLAAGRPAAETPAGGAARAVPPVIGFFYFAGVAALMLPTTFGRGCLVALFHHLLCLAVLIPVALVLYSVGLDADWWSVPDPDRVADEVTK
ncbi:MAG: hypothetical protein K2X82_31245 [Gemmataceae bacterium]|nr:hypothetical protein [Gemmataceae bacterium]